MVKEIFVIGIGGTGMRCLESFIHLCAIGMFDNTTVNMLALDTDKLNGNFKRIKHMIGAYNELNKNTVKSNTFFSACINYVEFSPDYNKNSITFNSIADYSGAHATQLGEGDGVKYRKSDIADLFLNPEVRDMSLEHGYRAQTQLGSMLMYHAIIEEAYKTTRRADYDSELRKYIKQLNDSKGNQIFIFGSVFGGTGASSIPIIPRAFQKAAQIMFGEQSEVLSKNFYGSVVLTNYFSFNIQKTDKIVATSDKFALNSQAALMFYEADETVKNTYRRLYLLGRQDMRALPNTTKTDTGGEKQENPVDYIELLAAFAAYDFFNVCDKGDEAFKSGGTGSSQFYYISCDENIDKLDFINFTDANEEFKKKFGIFTATVLFDAHNNFFAQKRNEEFQFPEEDLKALYNYMHLFYNTEQHTGWAPQLYESAKTDYAKGILLHSDIFKEGIPLNKLKYNEMLYDEDTPPSFKIKGGVLGFGGSIFNTVKDTFKDIYPDKKLMLEHLLERTYATFLYLYFNEKIN